MLSLAGGDEEVGLRGGEGGGDDGAEAGTDAGDRVSEGAGGSPRGKVGRVVIPSTQSQPSVLVTGFLFLDSYCV